MTGNIIIQFDKDSICLHTEWGGGYLINTLQDAMKRGQKRWDTPGYLSRIIFSEMVKDFLPGQTGFSILPYPRTDTDLPDVVVDCRDQHIYVWDKGCGKQIMSFQDFIELDLRERGDVSPEGLLE